MGRSNPHPYKSERDKIVQRRCSAKARRQVFEHYGQFCICCGENNIWFLTIDHINGGGTKHRDEIKRYGTAFYSWLRFHGYPEGYQTLCFNCNCAKSRVGICPHQQIVGKLINAD